MCGLAGLFHLSDDAPVDDALLTRMTDVQAHRGPDSSGFLAQPGIGLGHRRLAIIDLVSGQQPMQAGDGRFTIIFNGAIYNFPSLREELQGLGAVFQTHSDTEVLLKAYIEWGEDCLRRLNGMFAFAIWDAREKTLFLARDRVGEKPLYYAVLPSGWLAFSSELKGLLECDALPRTINPRAVDAYFSLGYVPDNLCIIDGVQKLPAGHMLTVTQGKDVPRPRQYWSIDFAGPGAASTADLPEQCRAHLKETVSAQMISDVPLGAFLSGGVDSSVVVATMAGLSSTPIKTCAIGFDVPQFDETAYAQQVADIFQTDHRTQIVSQYNLSVLGKMASIFDEPFADNSCIPSYKVCRLARQHVTVALSGDGGDEVFAGYRRHRFHVLEERLRRTLPRAIRTPLFSALASLYPKLDWAPQVFRAKSTFAALARDTADAYFHSVSITSQRERDAMRGSSLKHFSGGSVAQETFRQIISDVPDYDPLSAVQYLDFKTWLVGDILTKVDRTSMANGLEVRVPLLNHRFLNWASKVPPQARLKNREAKWVLKKAFEGQLPRQVLYRKKMGFASPLDAWIRGELRPQVEQAILSPLINDLGVLSRDGAGQLLKEHLRGTRQHGRALFSILMLERSLNRLIGGAT